MTDTVATPVRSVIVGAWVVCLGVAMAPWWSGGQEPVAMLVSGFALLLGALLAWRQPEIRRLRRGPLVVAWTVLMGFALLSLLWTASRYATALWVVEWLMAGLAFRLAYAVAGEPRGREWMLRVYLASAAVFAAAAVWMYVTGSYDRLTGTFYWANPAAAYLMPAIILGVDRARRAAGRMVYGWLGASVGFLAAFLLADSRAAMAVLGLVMAVYLLVVPTSKRFWIKFVFIVLMGAALSMGLVRLGILVARHGSQPDAKVMPGSRLAQVADGASTSGRDRLDYLDSVLEMWWQHPWGGTGAGTYGDVHPQYQQRVVSASSNAHNLYAQTLAELGLVGALALAAVVLWLVAGAARGLVADPATLPVLLGLAALGLHFGLDIDASYPALLMLAAVLAGLAYRQWGQVRAAASWRWSAVAALVLVPLVSGYLSNARAVQGQAAQEDGDYSLAADRYAAAHSGVFYNPDYVNAEGIDWYTQALGGGSVAVGDFDRALDRARQAQRLDPHDGQHHELEGRVLAARGDWWGAQAAFREALRLDPYNHPEYALDLAAAQVRAGDAAGGERTARAMLALYPDAVVANRHLDETLRPNLASLAALAGNVELRAGRIADARAAARQALHYDAENLAARGLEVQVGKAAR